MILQQYIKNYIEDPLPLWNNELTVLLKANKLNQLQSTITSDKIYDYNIVNSITKKQNNVELVIPLQDNDIAVAIPTIALQSFYEKHGLVVSHISEKQHITISKIKNALTVIRHIPDAFSFINNIIKSVQIIEAETSDTDISYSHPDIPFSIFFSVCETNSAINDIRVAESILHESMHLLLTLIESHVDLIVPDSVETFFSPWRNEVRPLRGVLHGLFVFKAIKDFYELLAKEISGNLIEISFIKFRTQEIKKEFEVLKKFPDTHGLTIFGKTLAERLLNN